MVFSQHLKNKIHKTLRLKQALEIVWQSSRNWMLARLFLLVVQATLPLFLLYLMKVIVDSVSIAIASTNKEESSTQIMMLIALTGVISLIISFGNLVAELVSAIQSEIVSDYMYGIVHAKAIEVDLEYYENSQYHDTLQRAQKEAYFRPSQILSSLLQLGENGISLVAIASLLFWFHWQIAAILLVATIPAVFVRFKYADEMYQLRHIQTATERKASYLDWTLTSSSYAKEIRLFNLGTLLSYRFRQLRRNLRRENLAITKRNSIRGLVTQTSVSLAIYGSYALIAYQTILGHLTLGDLVLYYQAFQRGQSALEGFLKSLARLYEDNLFLANLYEFLELQPKLLEPLHPEPIPHLKNLGIQFDRVSFQYPNSNRRGLKDINLSILPGQVVAFVGKNGSGKTTLVKLLSRLYDPTEGSIRFEGVDLRQFAAKDLRRQISIIFQDYVKYYLTAKENIWFGNIDISPDDKKITASACQSGADEVIASLPKGYDTILGKWFANGEELSIGQWQKVALARAFLRDSQIIVLDEPTSAMDPEAEHEVFQKFRQLINGQTAILISHRLSTVKMADRIYLLEEGGISESGTHEELMLMNGIYSHLFKTQAQHYKSV